MAWTKNRRGVPMALRIVVAATAIGSVLATAAVAQQSTSGTPSGPLRGQQQGFTEPREFLPETAEDPFAPQGLRAGTFLVFPTLGLGATYDDNIFAADNATEEDMIYTVTPGVSVQSQWNNHALNFFADGEIGRYADFDNEDYEDYAVGTDGRIDITRAANFYGALRFAEDHEERGSPDDANGIEPTDFTSLNFRGGYFQKFNRVSLRAEADWTSLDYDDVATTTGVINNDDRDRDTIFYTGRVGYEFIDGYEAFLRGRFYEVEYDSTVDDSGLNRSGDGYDGVAGLVFDLTALTQVEVFGGFVSKDYDDPLLSEIDGPMYGGALNWSPRRYLVVRGAVQRSVEETTQVDYAGYLSTNYSLNVEYRFRPDLRLTAGGSFTTSDYDLASNSAAQEREDEVLGLNAGARYYITRFFFAGLNYSFQQRQSNLAGQDYDRNQIALRGGFQY